MAKIYFQKLRKQNYSYSDIELLGIEPNPKNPDFLKAQIRFLRYNKAGEMYESAVGVYLLQQLEGLWLIKEMSIYKDNESVLSALDLSQMWHPEKTGA